MFAQMLAQLSDQMFLGHRLVSALRRWPVESQQHARRNAMVASNALARRRAELDEVEEFLASLSPRSTSKGAAQAAQG